VSIFYVLPPRPWLAERVAGLLQTFFPGLGWDAERRAELTDLLGLFGVFVEDAEKARGHADVYVVHREDLPAGEALDRALADGFGAEPGDEVVEVRPSGRPGATTARRWKLSS
jgi:hypothetical protein